MANHKSAIKRARQNQVRNLRNRSVRTRIKNVVKQVRQAVDENSPEKAKEALHVATRVIDKGASKGVIHRNTASRKISRLAKQVKSLEA
ncbi:MAG: 30S ribosomal protein S20 [Desulfatibacillaceae bacterium]